LNFENSSLFHRSKAQHFLKVNENHPAIHKLRFNEPLTRGDIQELEKMLLDAGTGTADDLNRAKQESYRLGLFLRSLVGLDREAAMRSFDAFLRGKNPTANQIEFLNLMIEHLTQRGWTEASALYESPFTDFSPKGVEGVFDSAQVGQLLSVLSEICQRAAA
jgi:type I restriction enzyme, R subunit